MTVSVRPAPAQFLPDNAPFTPEQRAWLNGFFAGFVSFTDGTPAPGPSVGAVAPEPIAAPADGSDDAPWHHATMPLAERMTLAEGRPLRRRMMAAMGQQDCGQCGYNCQDYADALYSGAEKRLNLCVPGGKDTTRTLKRLYEEERGHSPAPAPTVAPATAPPRAPPIPGRSRDCPVDAVFLSRRRLNTGDSDKVTNHIEFDLSGAGLNYEVGDSFGVFPHNDAALVDAVIAAIGGEPDFPIAGRTLRDALLTEYSLGAAPDMLFHLFSFVTGGDRRVKAKTLAVGADPDGDAATLDVLAAIQKFPNIRPDPEAFVEALEPLQPRLYSISSSPKADPGRVALTVDAVRYRIAERERLGVASTFLGGRAAPGVTVKAYIQQAHGFALPVDDAAPIIMVGPGTGIAPFRAFLRDRRATGAKGKTWLFFGHRRRASDYLYGDEIEAMAADGALTRLSLAWSREPGRKKSYVQDRMREDSAELYAWLESGAHFYVCGDAKRMASDVDAALIEIVAAQSGRSVDDARAYVAALKNAGRYQTDVY